MIAKGEVYGYNNKYYVERSKQHALRINQMDLFDFFSTNELVEAQPCIFDDLDGIGGKPELSDDLTYDPEL